MPGAEAFARLDADWPAPPRVRAFTTLRRGPGVSRAPYDAFNLGLRSGDDPLAAQANRDALHAAIATPRAPRWLRQVHGTDVLRVDADARDGGEEPTADASVTAVPGLPLAILTADCLPVLFAAPDASEIGAAHAGWPGLSAGVLEATLAAMATPASKLLAWIGPGAGPARYEVGENVRAAFVDRDAGAAAHFSPTRPGHWLADLPALARRRLAAAGVQRVFGGTRCTISEPESWYSYRRDGATGRMASLIWINPADG
jgi:YfiH family protein